MVHNTILTKKQFVEETNGKCLYVEIESHTMVWINRKQNGTYTIDVTVHDLDNNVILGAQPTQCFSLRQAYNFYLKLSELNK